MLLIINDMGSDFIFGLNIASSILSITTILLIVAFSYFTEVNDFILTYEEVGDKLYGVGYASLSECTLNEGNHKWIESCHPIKAINFCGPGSTQADFPLMEDSLNRAKSEDIQKRYCEWNYKVRWTIPIVIILSITGLFMFWTWKYFTNSNKQKLSLTSKSMIGFGILNIMVSIGIISYLIDTTEKSFVREGAFLGNGIFVLGTYITLCVISFLVILYGSSVDKSMSPQIPIATTF